MNKMSRAAVSNLVWGIYLVLLSLTLFAIPDVILKVVGLEPHKDVWIYVVALLAFNLSLFFFANVRTESVPGFWASVGARSLTAVTLVVLAVLHLTRVNLVGFSVPDARGATWTALALRADGRTK
ncbi:MAG TPA: hypothetical protein VGR57_11665 [Ktedonobacterales bacterium]|nr:hypothetical protein [Ktedonobacterales bacterium]